MDSRNLLKQSQNNKLLKALVGALLQQKRFPNSEIEDWLSKSELKLLKKYNSKNCYDNEYEEY